MAEQKLWGDARNLMQVFMANGECHEGPEGEERYSSTLSLTSALDVVGGHRHAPDPLPPEMTQYPLCNGGLAPGPVWKGAENLAPFPFRNT